MPIQVKLFASLRERAGWSEQLVVPAELPATPQSLWRELQLSDGSGTSEHPSRAGAAASDVGGLPACSDAAANNGLPDGIRVAINRSFAAADAPLVDGDELAFLPPISGG